MKGLLRPFRGGRTWPQVKHFMGKHMKQFVSGAVAFQWSMDHEEYGAWLANHSARKRRLGLYLISDFLVFLYLF